MSFLLDIINSPNPSEAWATFTREGSFPGIPHFISQWLIWLFFPAIPVSLTYFFFGWLARRFPVFRGWAKYIYIAFGAYTFSFFPGMVYFLSAGTYGSLCELYEKDVSPQLVYSDGVAVIIMMFLHMVIEQADMKSSFFGLMSTLTPTMLAYPTFLWSLDKRAASENYRISDNQRWARWLYLVIGIAFTLHWLVPIVRYWNTYHSLDLGHAGSPMNPDPASDFFLAVVIWGWFMFGTWAVPQFRNPFFAFLFSIVGLSHVGFAMALFLFIRGSAEASAWFLFDPSVYSTGAVAVAAAATNVRRPAARK